MRIQQGKSKEEKETRVGMMPKVLTFEMYQDDPKKCTSAKMRRLGLARRVSRRAIPRGALVLNPGAKNLVTKADRESVVSDGVVVIDCSWKKADKVFSSLRLNGVERKLPALLAGNPTNYSKIGSLSSLEAAAACLFITGFKEESQRLLSIYKWGNTFLTLNHDPLEDYSKAETEEELKLAELSFFPQLLSQ